MIVQGRKFKKMYGSGGDMSAVSNNVNNKMTLGQYTDAGVAGAGLVNSAVDAIAPANSYGVQSAAAMGIKRGVSYAATGAKLGSTFGPWGTAIGAGVGLVGGVASGLIGHAGAERTQMAMERQQQAGAWDSQVAQGNARIQSDPSMIYGNRNAQAFADGGALPVKSVKDFYNSYLNSPTYTNRLTASGYTNPSQVVQDRLKNLNSAKVKSINSGTNNYTKDSYIGSSYYPAGNIATVDHADISNFHVNNSDLVSHELGHSVGDRASKYPSNLTLNKGEQSYINSKNKLGSYNGNNPDLLHDADPSELKADLDNIRYRMYNDKVYDITKGVPFTQQDLDKANKTYSSDGNFQRLKSRLKDKDLIEMMNTLASNKPTNVSTQVAAMGGKLRVSTYADGGGLPTGPAKGKLPTQPAYYIDGLPTTMDVGNPLANKTWSKTNPFLVDKGNGVMSQWGNDLPTPPAPIVPVPTAPIPLSDKARGLDNTYNTSRDQPRGPAIPTQHRSAGYYGKGGIMKKMYADGGQLQPMNSQAVQVDGPSHAQGGVQIHGAEVEGGETISNGFVFSDQLGFADLHKPIAKAIGKIEDKPMNAVRNRTLQLLKGKEQGLAMSQELYKRHMGLPSDLD